MRRVLVLLLLAGTVASAQEGFPLDGTWRGQRTGEGDTPATIVMILQWDGKKVTGIINPGPKQTAIADARLITEGWRVRVAAHTAAGQDILFEGALGELGSYHRSITGTWKEGGHSYQVRMVRE